MENIILSPQKYIQGYNSIKKIANFAGKKAFIISDEFIYNLVHSSVKKSFDEAKIPFLFEIFQGECSKNEISRLQSLSLEKEVGIIIGIGGGKTLDTAKAIAHFSELPVMIVPTIASTDAPCSALSVLYNEDGSFDEYLMLSKNPDIILMDTAIISKAPYRLLVSGMGDALATYFEARACSRSNALNMGGGLPTKTALTLAKLCYETLISDGEKALFAAKNRVCTKALENIIEANTYLSGIGFESGGLAAAHAIHNGLTILEETHKFFHGEKVAFGTLVQLFLENAPLSEIEEVVEFCKKVSLPICLKDLGVETINLENLKKVATLSCKDEETMKNMPFSVTPDMVLAAILSANNYGESKK